MIRQIKILLLFCMFSLQFYTQEETHTVNTTAGELEGSLLLPEQKQNIPLVIIIAGSGPTDRNGNQGELENNSLKMLAQALAKNGIASLRYDKRGVGPNNTVHVDEMELKLEDFSDDVKRWIDYLSVDKRFSSIIVAGHSEGSLLGMIASIDNKRVKAFISIAGPGRPLDELLKEQLDSIMPEKIKATVYPMLDRVKKGDTIRDVPRIYYALLRPSVQPFLHSAFKYNPQNEIKKLKIPVLLVQGDADYQVKVKDAELLAAAQPMAQKVIVKHMNHVLKTVESARREDQKEAYTDGTIPINEECVSAIVAFIRSHTTPVKFNPSKKG